MAAHHFTTLDLIMTFAAAPLVALILIFLMQELVASVERFKSRDRIYLTKNSESDELTFRGRPLS